MKPTRWRWQNILPRVLAFGVLDTLLLVSGVHLTWIQTLMLCLGAVIYGTVCEDLERRRHTRAPAAGMTETPRH